MRSLEGNHMEILGYYVNLAERGSFYADVRTQDGVTVFEFHAGASLPEGESSLVEDGFMSNERDVVGLEKYLKHMGIISKTARILSMSDAERAWNSCRDSDDEDECTERDGQ